ncbi:MAG: bifunctional alpha/beta hydrolase/OsmC family protein [Rhodovibrionaceae bacterium]|nr:bifunctional alpha/beta hydrolase/OsmC family protein [Rhodovibrionaceae bacterium]
MRSEKFSFTGAHGDELAGRLDLPPGKPRAYGLFAHCFTCSKDIFAATRIAEALAERGIAVLRFDFTGLGHSEGEFANTNFTSNIEDLIAAAEALKQQREAPKLLIGHSLGGAAVLAAAGKLDSVQAIATIGAPADPAHVAHVVQDKREEIEKKGEAEVKIVGRSFRIRKQFLDDIESHRLAETIGRLKRPLLIFHAPLDDIVGIDNATEIFKAAKHPKSFVSLDDADHILSKRMDAVYVGEVLSAWATRYLGDLTETAGRPKAEEGKVVVMETREGRFTQAISAGGHALRADEPESIGGLGSGPAPYDFLLAGLGACTSMTLRLYAERKEWPLERATVELEHDRIHAEDCEDCETKDGKVDRIRRKIALEGNLDDEQRQRLLEIADKCPVHRTLTSEIKIETQADD